MESMKQHDALLVNTRDAAEMLGISRASLYRLLKANQIKSFLIPGTRCRRISVDELKKIVSQAREQF